jgi:hypothetical protein
LEVEEQPVTVPPFQTEDSTSAVGGLAQAGMDSQVAGEEDSPVTRAEFEELKKRVAVMESGKVELAA